MTLTFFSKGPGYGIIWSIILILLGSLVLTACGTSSNSQTAVASPILMTIPPDATATATPFQPDLGQESGTVGNPQSTAQPTFATWGDFPAPQVFPVYTQVPPPVNHLPQPSGQVNILLLGSDQRPNDSGFRTDTIILITLNPDGRASLTSFPRDLYVYIPGWMMQRINSAMGFGGFNALRLTFEYNFGITPDYYVLINFDGFRRIINNLGGITVNVGQTFSDARSGYPNGYAVYPGPVAMDSETALWYVRSRYSSNDIDRLRRAQEVLQAIGQKLFSLDGLNHVPDLFNTYKSTVETNLTLDATLRLLPAANLIHDPSSIRRYVIGYDQAYDWVEPSTGAMVLLPVYPEIQKILQQAQTLQ